MSVQELEQCLQDLPGVKMVRATGDGYRYELLVVSDCFIGLLPVARQKWVYAQLGNLITSGRVHAITLRTLTKDEWEKQHG